MTFNVPQFIDVEDKIAGPLTWKQLLWMIGLGAVLLVLFNAVTTTFFFILAIPVVLLFAALAFYRPNNQPFIIYIIHGAMFLFRPKVAVWERPVNAMPRQKPVRESEAVALPRDKKVTMAELQELARIVDSRGSR